VNVEVPGGMGTWRQVCAGAMGTSELAVPSIQGSCMLWVSFSESEQRGSGGTAAQGLTPDDDVALPATSAVPFEGVL